MNHMKKIIAGALVVLTLAAGPATAFAAADYETPAEAAAGVTGKTLKEVAALRRSGKSYGTIADEAGKLEEFQQAMLDIWKDTLDELVADGTLTQEQADAQLDAIEQQQEACDGTGIGTGCGFGRGQGRGNGCGFGRGGQGRGNGRGMGMGLRNGSCLY